MEMYSETVLIFSVGLNFYLLCGHWGVKECSLATLI